MPGQLFRKFLITAPFALLLGACFGLLVTHDRGGGAGIILLFTFGFLLVTFITQLLHLASLRVLRISPDTVEAEGVGVLWDVIVGVVMGGILAPILGVSVLRAVGLGSSMLFIQGFVIGKLLLDNLIGDAIGGFLMPSGVPGPPQYSLADAHAARGDFAAARAQFAEHVKTAPRDPRPLIALARMEREHARDYIRAADALQRVLALPQLDFGIETSVTRELAELMLHRLDRGGQALSLLARYSHRYRDRPDARWARKWLEAAKTK